MSMDAMLVVEGLNMSMSMDMKIDVNAVGSAVVINYPADLGEYMEIDM